MSHLPHLNHHSLKLCRALQVQQSLTCAYDFQPQCTAVRPSRVARVERLGHRAAQGLLIQFQSWLRRLDFAAVRAVLFVKLN